MDPKPNNINLTPYEHRARHYFLHQSLDELIADWIWQSGKRPSQGTVLELIEWSYQQTKNPTDKPI